MILFPQFPSVLELQAVTSCLVAVGLCKVLLEIGGHGAEAQVLTRALAPSLLTVLFSFQHGQLQKQGHDGQVAAGRSQLLL